MYMKNITFIFCLIVCLSAAIVPVVSAAGINEGWIQIISNVDGASVYFDNNYQGLTSDGQLVVTVYMATPVSTVRVEKSGFTSAEGTLTMPYAGATTVFTATLRPVLTPTPVPPYGSMWVGSSPAGAKIYINGYYRGISPLTLDQMTPGSYTVDAVLNGYLTYTTMFRISAGSTTNVYCTLQSISSSPNSVYVTSDPANAFVYLDTIFKGKTPLTITDVSTGDHQVELNAPGYYSWKTTVNLPGGGTTSTVSAQMTSLATSGGSTTTVTASLTPTTTVTASLTPLPAATKSGAAPVVVIAALGIIMLVAGIMQKKN
jgi:hypothetical protein